MTRDEIDTCDDTDVLHERLGELADETAWIESRLWVLAEERGNPELIEQRRDYFDGLL